MPDVPATLAGLDETVELLAAAKIPLRIDPILEPIGFGFAASLGRYLDVRRRYPDAEMLMGIGNLTELTDADSAAINVLLLGFCQELGIRSVLTTQVINWARSSVAECDLARRLVHFAVAHRMPPKHLDDGLVMLRDPAVPQFGQEYLETLAREIRDHNYRMFAEAGQVHAVTAGRHWAQSDPFLLFEQLAAAAPKPIDANHAFYLGYEMAKAITALTLGKDYRQDEALDWGFLTRRRTRTAWRAEGKAETPPRMNRPVWVTRHDRFFPLHRCRLTPPGRAPGHRARPRAGIWATGRPASPPVSRQRAARSRAWALLVSLCRSVRFAFGPGRRHGRIVAAGRSSGSLAGRHNSWTAAVSRRSGRLVGL